MTGSEELLKRAALLLGLVASCGTQGGAIPPPSDAAVDDASGDASSRLDASSHADASDASPIPVDAGPRVVDPSTMTGKLLMGYQGWFLCPGDGAPPDRWVHWFRGPPYDAATFTIDMWPSTSELDPGELCPTTLTLPNGNPAPLYSAYRASTVLRHFKWMKDNDLDGVFLQRFTSELGDPAFKAARDQVLRNVMAGAEAHGRVFAVEYDISGQDPTTLVSTLENDWAYLVDVLKVTKSPRYLSHHGKPVLIVWGFGFQGRPGTPQQASDVIAYFKSGAPADKQVTLGGGVPRDWRTDATWGAVTRSFDIITPWTVGAFVDDPGADGYKSTIVQDLADAKASGREVMPTIFPGFSWKNLNGGPLNQIPRRAGKFYWRQAFNAVGAGSTMIFGAMFDEVDEGTAMYKLAPTAKEMPAQGTLVSLDIDGTKLPDDWYLRVANEAGKMLRGASPVTATLPITPP